MPARYRRKPGSRRYCDYTESELQECLAAVRHKILTQRKASEKYRIPRSTIKNKLAGRNKNKPGHPTVFTDEEEATIVAYVSALAEYGFPVTEFDLKMIIKDYLNSRGRSVPCFKNGNIAGYNWVKSFLRRHKSLSRRLSNNIKRVRAQVSEDVITNFIDNLADELEGVPPQNVYNYDETNLSDDPGRKTIICRRGMKYPESIVNATKASFTVMFCGNAAGESLPPLIIYKSEHLWSTWTSNGPPGARYNRTKSGWIDTVVYEDWFLNLVLPILKKQPGKKVVIGDNLSSHISEKVLKACEENNISFICLPPNATHILQPLDVAYFRPLKCMWRQVLQEWKCTTSGRSIPTTPKELFPGLLKKALDAMTESKENMIAGFKKTGIVPINKEEPLSRLPQQDRILHQDLISESFIQQLKQSRADVCPSKTAKKKKLNVAPGKSISMSDIAEAGPSSAAPAVRKNLSQRANNTISSRDLTDAGSSGITRNIQKGKRAKKRPRPSISSTTSCDTDMTVASSTEDQITNDHDSYEELPKEEDEALNRNPLVVQAEVCGPETVSVDNVLEEDEAFVRNSPVVQAEKCDPNSVSVGDHVLVVWNNRKYPGEIISVCEEGVFVNCMKKGAKFWRWPVIKDEQLYSWDKVECKIAAPKFEKKGCFSIPELIPE